MKIKQIIQTIFILSLIILSIYNTILYFDLKKEYIGTQNVACEHAETFQKLLDLSETKKTLQGFYYNDTVYCVWLKNRTTEEIANTRNHEICHALVYRDYEHFCSKIKSER